MGRQFLRVSQVAERLGVSYKTAMQLVEDGYLPGAFRLPGNHWRVPSEAVEGLKEAGRSSTAAV